LIRVGHRSDPVGEGAENLAQLGERPLFLVVEDGEIAMVLDVGERIEDDLLAVAAMAGEILVMDGGAGQRSQAIPQVNDAAADVHLVHVVFDFLVEAADVHEQERRKLALVPCRKTNGSAPGTT